MAQVISRLKPYAAYELIDPDSDGDPYFTFGVFGCSDGRYHGVRRKLIYDFGFHPDEGKGQCISIHHAIGDFFLYGANLAPVFTLLPTIHDLIVFSPRHHQPVTDSTAPIFTRAEVKKSAKRYAEFQKRVAANPALLMD